MEYGGLFLRMVSFYKTILKNNSVIITPNYKLAIENGSTMIRVGSAIFGVRNYQ
jgi:uncharacterized pyridoxal phosphate-containing UPF0001 family protein